MINPRQKMLLHIYKDAADLSDPTYRNILREAAGVSSAAEPAFNQAGFERAMSLLETSLFIAVHAGRVPNPIGLSRHIRREFYWRKRLPGAGMITTRQAHAIRQKWNRLCEFLPDEKCTPQYFHGIVEKAIDRVEINLSGLTGKEAGFIIDALDDRLSYAVMHAEEEALTP